MIPQKHYKITISGKVQGVWYRKFILKSADNMKLKGFVENLENGKVYIEVVCNLWDYQLFLEKIKKGSPLSNVTNVEITEGEPKEFKIFEIKR